MLFCVRGAPTVKVVPSNQNKQSHEYVNDASTELTFDRLHKHDKHNSTRGISSLYASSTDREVPKKRNALIYSGGSVPEDDDDLYVPGSGDDNELESSLSRTTLSSRSDSDDFTLDLADDVKGLPLSGSSSDSTVHYGRKQSTEFEFPFVAATHTTTSYELEFPFYCIHNDSDVGTTDSEDADFQSFETIELL